MCAPAPQRSGRNFFGYDYRMQQHPSTDSAPAPAPTDPDDIDGVDILLGVLTLVPLLFVLMFATSGMADRLRNRSARRTLGIWLLAAEAITVAILVGVLVS